MHSPSSPEGLFQTCCGCPVLDGSNGRKEDTRAHWKTTNATTSCWKTSISYYRGFRRYRFCYTAYLRSTCSTSLSPMLVARAGSLALRCIVGALLLESALSFRSQICTQRYHYAAQPRPNIMLTKSKVEQSSSSRSGRTRFRYCWRRCAGASATRGYQWQPRSSLSTLSAPRDKSTSKDRSIRSSSSSVIPAAKTSTSGADGEEASDSVQFGTLATTAGSCLGCNWGYMAWASLCPTVVMSVD